MFSKVRILVIGDVMLDRYTHGSIDRISPEAPVPVVNVSHVEDRLGGAANVALNIKSLGGKVSLCSIVGNDSFGKEFIRLLYSNNISGEAVLTIKKRITTVKTRILSKGQQILRYDSENSEYISDGLTKTFLEKIRLIISQEKPHALIFQDYNKGLLSENLIEEVTSICRIRNTFISVDPKQKNFFAYKNVNLFKPNLREIHDALQIDINAIDATSLNSVHSELQSKLNHNMTLLTLGDKGIFFSNGKQSGIIPAHKRDVSDVSGAGDTVIAVATLALAAGMKLNDAADIANLAGGLVCEHAGVVPITREMLQKEIS